MKGEHNGRLILTGKDLIRFEGSIPEGYVARDAGILVSGERWIRFTNCGKGESYPILCDDGSAEFERIWNHLFYLPDDLNNKNLNNSTYLSDYMPNHIMDLNHQNVLLAGAEWAQLGNPKKKMKK